MKKLAATPFSTPNAIIIFLLVTLLSFIGWDRYNQPIITQEYISYDVAPSMLRAGAMLRIVSTFDRTAPENCHYTVERFITRSNDGVVVFTQIAPGVGGVGTHIRSMNEIELPKALKPGMYGIQSRAINDCGAYSLIRTSPRRSFIVIE